MKRKILKQLDLPEYKQPLNSVIEFLDNLSYSAVKQNTMQKVIGMLYQSEDIVTI